MNDIVRAVSVDNNARSSIVKRHVAYDQAIIHLARDGDPVPVLRAMDRIECNGGISRPVVRIQSVDNTVAELIANNLDTFRLVGVEAEMKIAEYAVDNNARWTGLIP